MTIAQRNNYYLDKDVSRDGASEKSRRIKRGASGCQVRHNKYWVPCRQRPRSSQTDTGLDPPLSGSKLKTTDATNVDHQPCLFQANSLFRIFFLSVSPLISFNKISSYPSSSYSSNSFSLPPFNPLLHRPSLHLYNADSRRLCCSPHIISLIHN